MCDTDADASDVAENPDPEADAAAEALCSDELTHSDEAESDIRGVHEHDDEVEGNPSRRVDHNSNLQNGDQDEAGNHLQDLAHPLLDVATVDQRVHPIPEDVHTEGSNGNDQLWPDIAVENNRSDVDGAHGNASIAINNSECLGNAAPEDEILEYPIRIVGELAEDFEPECDQAPVICDENDNDCECMNDDDDDDELDDDEEEEEEDVEEEEEEEEEEEDEEDDDSENLLEPSPHKVRMEGELMNVCCSPVNMNVREASIVYCESDESESGAPMSAQRGYESPEFSSPSNGASQQGSVYKVSNKFNSLLADSNSECSSDETAVINFNQIQARGSQLLTEPVTSPLPGKDSCANTQFKNIEISQDELSKSHSPLTAGSPQNKTHSVYYDQVTDDIEVGQDATSLASQSNDSIITACPDTLSTEYTTSQTVVASLDLSVSNHATHGSSDQVTSINWPANSAVSQDLTTCMTDAPLMAMANASSPESGIECDHSKTPASIQTPVEDQLLSELEAELDTPKLLPSQSGLPLNGMAKIDLNQLPEFLELKRQLQLANMELAAKEDQVRE